MNLKIPSYQQISDYVIQHFLMEYTVKEDVSTFLSDCHQKFEGDFEKCFYQIDKLNPIFFTYKDYSFPVFFGSANGNNNGFTSEDKLCFDVILNSFLMLSGIQEWIIEKRDKHGRFSYYDSLQYKHDFIKTPVVNIYFKLLAEALKSKGVEIKVKEKEDRAIVMTHDIDQLNMGYIADFFYNVRQWNFRSFLKLPAIALKAVFYSKDIFRQNINTLIREENAAGVRSIFFMLVEKGKNEADYTLSKGKNLKVVQEQLSAGGEVQLHPGFNTYNNIALFKKQKNDFEAIAGVKLTKVRQHFLKYDVRKTTEIHEAAGIQVDYSLGFAEHYGFRNSSCSPFYLYNFDKQRISKVLEVPIYLMDGTITDYLKGDRTANAKDALAVMEKVSIDFNTSFSVLFHNIFKTDKYTGVWEMFLGVMELCKKAKK